MYGKYERLFDSAVINTFIWQNANYIKLYLHLLMRVRSKGYKTIHRGIKIQVPAHTVIISVRNTDIPEISHREARTFFNKLAKCNYIQMYVKQRITHIKFLDSEIYTIHKKSKDKTNHITEPIQANDFDYIKDKIKQR
jgi:hypothetical protein